ncbi:MAG: prepilin-type N-terminal cleavage/methylation domain-containing protein, partial [Gemmatimonadetes bacterium]
MTGGRRGFTLIEVVVAAALTSVLVGAAVALAGGSVALARRVAQGAETLAALRDTREVLAAELGAGRAGLDWFAAPRGDSVALRAYRLTALVCAAGPGGVLVVSAAGWRRADPAKDSAVVLDDLGRWWTVDLVDAAAVAAGDRGVSRAGTPLPGPPCGAAAPELRRWRLDPPVPGARLLRVFERGSYHLSGGALRYRRGRAGRQPLTAPALRAVGLAPEADAVRV